jgi:hypothetical protein
VNNISLDTAQQQAIASKGPIRALQVVCDHQDVETLTKIFSSYQLPRALGTFVPISGAKTHPRDYTAHIVEHATYLDNLANFQVTGLAPEVLYHSFDDPNTGIPTCLWSILTEFPYSDNAYIAPINAISSKGHDGVWYFNAPRASVTSAIQYSAHILTAFATTLPPFIANPTTIVVNALKWHGIETCLINNSHTSIQSPDRLGDLNSPLHSTDLHGTATREPAASSPSTLEHKYPYSRTTASDTIHLPPSVLRSNQKPSPITTTPEESAQRGVSWAPQVMHHKTPTVHYTYEASSQAHSGTGPSSLTTFGFTPNKQPTYHTPASTVRRTSSPAITQNVLQYSHHQTIFPDEREALTAKCRQYEREINDLQMENKKLHTAEQQAKSIIQGLEARLQSVRDKLEWKDEEIKTQIHSITVQHKKALNDQIIDNRKLRDTVGQLRAQRVSGLSTNIFFTPDRELPYLDSEQWIQTLRLFLRLSNMSVKSQFLPGIPLWRVKTMPSWI